MDGRQTVVLPPGAAAKLNRVPQRQGVSLMGSNHDGLEPHQTASFKENDANSQSSEGALGLRLLNFTVVFTSGANQTVSVHVKVRPMKSRCSNGGSMMQSASSLGVRHPAAGPRRPRLGLIGAFLSATLYAHLLLLVQRTL